MLFVILTFIAIVLAIPTADARGTGHHAGSGSHGGGHRGHIGGHQENHAGHRHFGGNHWHPGGNHKHFGGKRSHNSGISRHNSQHNYNYYRYGYSYTPSYSYRPYSSYRPRHYSPRSYSTNTPSYSSPTPYISIKTYPPSYSSETNTYNNNSAGTRNIEKDKEIKVTNNAEVSLLATDVEWNTVSACLSNKKSCSCYGYSGDRLAIPKESCELAAKYGWPQKPKNRT